MFITRKALVAHLQGMNPNDVLFKGVSRQSPQAGGYRAVAAIEALKKFVGHDSFCQKTHVTKRGKLADNPRWFRQLFTELEWGTGDICAGTVLSHLQAK